MSVVSNKTLAECGVMIGIACVLGEITINGVVSTIKREKVVSLIQPSQYYV